MSSQSNNTTQTQDDVPQTTQNVSSASAPATGAPQSPSSASVAGGLSAPSAGGQITPPASPQNTGLGTSPGSSTSNVFNPHAARQELLSLPQYTASSLFPNLGVWRSGQHSVFAVAGPTNGPIESVMCIAVGVISRKKAFLAPNGTFNPRFSEPLKNARSAKWQFTLEAPRDNAVFGPDWTATCQNLQTIQGQVARTKDKRHFLLNGQRLRMGRNIWEPKNEDNENPSRNAVTNNYPINRDCAEWWDLVKETHQINLMTVYDVNDTLNTRAETWESALVGALVEVTFSLRHFYMGVTPSRPEAYDVFSATVESISILEKPAPVLRSPFQQRVAQTKPRPVPQAPFSLQLSSSPSFTGSMASSLPTSATSTPGPSTSATATPGPSTSGTATPGASTSVPATPGASTSSSASPAATSGCDMSSVRTGKKRDHEGDDDDSGPPATRPKRGNGKGSS